jgi:hypothetical protein
MEMYGGTCPILSEVRAWFKDPALEDMGRKYWKKRSYIFQGFVVEDGLKEDNAASNPIRRFIIGPQIFQLIRGALLDPEMDNLPTDAIHGVDFKLAKTSKGGYADYSTSSWKRRERPLGDTEQAALKEHGLFNLSDFLPKKPGEVELKVSKKCLKHQLTANHLIWNVGVNTTSQPVWDKLLVIQLVVQHLRPLHQQQQQKILLLMLTNH